MELKNKLILLFFILCLIALIFIFLVFNLKLNIRPNFNNSQKILNNSDKNTSETFEEFNKTSKDLDSKEINKKLNARKIVMFHNGKGPMCLEALDFFETIDCFLEEHLTYEPDFMVLLNEKKAGFEKSEGVSESFEYYPMIFINNKAYSGFNEEIKESIKEDLNHS